MHKHKLKSGEMTGPDKIMMNGDHVHELPDGTLTGPAEESKTHVHALPDGSTTPSGPIEKSEDES